jgi:hypothetical protein
MNDLKVITEHRNQILSILEPMMVDFKREINEMRAEGASQKHASGAFSRQELLRPRCVP